LQRRRLYVRRTHVSALLGAFAVLAFAATGAVGAGTPSAIPNVDVSTIPAPHASRGGALNVVVTLDAPSVAVAAEQQGLTIAEQRQYSNSLEAQQDTLGAWAAGVGATELASVTTALNAVAFRVARSQVDELRALPGVASVRAIFDYKLDLSETVPYIGAAAVQAGGFDGTGIDVAVIDSGIDYTHQNFGGAGTAAAYTAAYGTTTGDARNKTLDGLLPTAKVVAGFDFVGEAWNGSPTTPPLAPDPDPIDCGPSAIPAPCAGGHGSHVSDIILGVGPNKGVAPGAKLLSFKACSAVSTSCSGVALLQAVAASLDPNGDGSIADRVDVINLSLGSSYGQVEDDLSFALKNASDAGAVVVAAAGNAADRPYIVGSPSTQAEVISVAQTQVPSAKLYLIDPSAAGFRSVGGSRQSWSAAATLVTGTLEYNTGSVAEKRGCNTDGSNPYAAGEHTGDILLVDRGGCNVSLKATNAAAAGAIAVVIGNNAVQAPGDLPPDFSFGGGAQSIAAYTITLRDANHLRGVPEETGCPNQGPGNPVCADPGASNAFGQPATIDPAGAANLVGNMVASSARGPTHSFNSIKPDIGAPGGSVSTEAGTGTGETPFGGTSGASPMVAGSAALLLDKNPSFSVRDVKTLLMSTAETNIGLNPVGLPGVLAPITRIGAGEVRVNRAFASGTAAWASGENASSLSFGYHAVSETKRLEKRVVVKNFGLSSKLYTITPSFRYADDAASGAVRVQAPSRIRVPAGETRSFEVKLRIDPSKLPVWTLNGGPSGGDGFRLQSVEFDGYITLNAGPNDNVHLAWQVLPHRSAEVEAEDDTFRLRSNGTATVELENDSRVLDGRVDVFALTGTSPRIDEDDIPGPGSNRAVVDLRAVGLRLVSIGGGNFGVQFGIDTFGARAHPNYPAEFDINIDSNGDGVVDRIIFNAENGGFGVSGQNVTAVFTCTNAACTAGTIAVFFFTDADLNSGNAIMTAPLSALGLTPTTQFHFSVDVFDNYHSGLLTDSIDTMTHTLATPKFTGTGLPAAIPAKGEADLNIASVAGGAAASPSQTGFLLMYRDAEGVTRSNSRSEADLLQVRTKKHHDDD
jgi:subtilisin family serine protease